jgi:hypothetical protein
MQRKVLFVFLLVVLWLSGCSLLDNDNQPSASITETPATVAPTFTPTPITSSELVVPTPITETKTTLTIWLPPEIVVSTEAGTAILNAQIETFRASHDDLEIIVEQKAVTGQGSILSYLRTGRNIAPAILPDLIVIPTSQLESALNQELIFPLDELIDASLIEDLYPAAVELAHQSEQTAGYPFVLTNLPQLAYHATTITHTVPITWEAFINLPDNQFAFPAAGQAGASILLQMYLDAGGSLINDAGQFELQLEPLATALQQLSLGSERFHSGRK